MRPQRDSLKDDDEEKNSCDECDDDPECRCFQCDGESCVDNCEEEECDGCKCQSCEGSDCENCECYECCEQLHEEEENEENEEDKEDEEQEQEEEGHREEPSSWAEKVVARVQQAAGTNYPLRIIQDDNPNGYADGKSIVITTGAIEKLDDDELAWLVSHEVIHNIKGDPQQKSQRTQRLLESVDNVISDASGPISGILGAIFIGAASHAINRLVDRTEESTADTAARTVVYNAGYDSSKAAQAMRKIDPSRHGKGGIFSTHPATDKRIKRLEE